MRCAALDFLYLLSQNYISLICKSEYSDPLFRTIKKEKGYEKYDPGYAGRVCTLGVRLGQRRAATQGARRPRINRISSARGAHRPLDGVVLCPPVRVPVFGQKVKTILVIECPIDGVFSVYSPKIRPNNSDFLCLRQRTTMPVQASHNFQV